MEPEGSLPLLQVPTTRSCHPEFHLEWEIFQTKVVEKIKTHFMFSNFGFENRAVYEVMWESSVQPDRPQMTVLRMRIPCWVPRAANVHWEYAILIAFPRQQWLRERASKFRFYVHCLCVNFLACRTNLYWAMVPPLWSFHDHTPLDTPHSLGLLWTSDRPDAVTSSWQHATLTRDRHPCAHRDSNPQSSKQAAADSRLWQRGHWDRHLLVMLTVTFSWKK